MTRAKQLAGERWSHILQIAGKRMALIAAMLLVGCGGGAPLSGTGAPMAQTPGRAISQVKQAPSKKTTADAVLAGDDAASGFEGRVKIRTDSQGRKWLGDVPYDVFFDNPLAIAAEGATVAGGTENRSSTAAPGNATTAQKTSTPTVSKPDQSQPSAENSGNTTKNDWSRLVDMDVLDAEVKRIRNDLAAQLQSVGKYNSHYQEIAVAGTTLAVVAEIVAEHGGTVSWKNNAPLVRDLGMKIHKAASAPGSPGLQATKTPYEQLVDTLDGNVPAGVGPSQPQQDFSEIASRDAIMKRMDHSFQWLKKSGPAKQVLRKQAENAIHESSLLAALGRVIAVGHYDSVDDPKYKVHADELSKSAGAVAAAVKSDDAAAFTDAVGLVQKRCDACHADFRFK
jgi:hypothetical protein